MNSPADLLLLALFMAAVLLPAGPLGRYIADVMENRPLALLTWPRRLEVHLYRLCGIRPEAGMRWTEYALAILLFNLLGALATYAILRLQPWLPLNPQGFAAPSADSAFNTALSFVTNTDWQGYAGETAMSQFSQMAALAVQNFLSAATGIAVAFALMRGFARHALDQIGNAWADLTRATLYLLLPLSLVLAVFFVSQGVIQNLSAYPDAHTLETTRYEQAASDSTGRPQIAPDGKPLSVAGSTALQTLPMGPVASQEAIKLLGTNGGGYFNANSAHPFENPSALTNFVQMVAIFLIPAALCASFGRVVGDPRQGRALLWVMSLLFVLLAAACIHYELQGNPALAPLGLDAAAGNLEGKETRFGVIASALFAAVTTAASCGAVNAMHDSFLPLGGGVPLVLMQLGEVVFGGVGSGLYGMLVFAVLGVFIAGLMIGRTPEYLGKKIESFEMKMCSLAILVTPLCVLAGAALAMSLAAGRAGIANPGAHGYAEILYAFTSAGNNNGSAFAGLAADTPFYNIALGLAAWFGRFGVIVPVLALAGSLAAKKRIPPGAGTMPTHGPLFVALLAATVLLVGLLNYVPALALGPIAEHLALFAEH
ncbi:MAG: potassium-transporting ATPase subunit KdpA [Rhodocyclaceae bacterium]|nr:potassium-transporting ATPase subunit KdpA [Rhodocyclaceae bacterium]